MDCRSPQLTDRRRVREARSSLLMRISWRISSGRRFKEPHEDAATVRDSMSCRPLSQGTRFLQEEGLQHSVSEGALVVRWWGSDRSFL
jgi:hypothetical protein